MPKTKISDVIVPEVFNPYVIERTSELSALEQSGIIENASEFDVLATTGGRLLNMPFWQDLSGEDEVLSDVDPLDVAKIESKKDVSALLMRGKAWSVNDLAKALSGDDPMQAIGNLVAAYWARRRQITLLSTLQGVFSSDTMTDNTLDIASAATSNTFTAETFLDAVYKMGDSAEKLTALAVHSATFSSLRKQDLIEFIQDSENRPIPTYMGHRVIVDDGLPKEDKTFTSYIFGQGAFALGNGGAPVPTETDRDSLAGDDVLINRQHFILHPRGIKFTDTAVDGESPSNLELQDSGNWERVYESKNVRMIQFKHKIDV